MKEDRISTWRDLEKFGIHPLTGESCGLSMRYLCDIDPDGVKFLESFLSVKFTDDNNSWNHYGKDGWKSVMLPWGMLQELGAYALFYDGCTHVAIVDWRTDGASAHYVEGFRSEQEMKDFKEMADKVYKSGYRIIWNSGTVRLRNRHVMSGRVE